MGPVDHRRGARPDRRLHRRDTTADVVVDGRELDIDGDGFWVGPTLLDNVTPDMDVYTEEIFGPVLAVVRVDTLDEAIDLINAQPVRQRHRHLHRLRSGGARRSSAGSRSA